MKLNPLVRAIRYALLFWLLAGLAACGENVRKDKPADVILQPVKTIVPIDKKLTARCPWPKRIKPSQAIEGGKKRRECLEQYERQFDGIDKVQGKPAEELK